MEWNSYGSGIMSVVLNGGSYINKFISFHSNVVKHIWVCFAHVLFLLIEITIFAYRCTTEQSVPIKKAGL